MTRRANRLPLLLITGTAVVLLLRLIRQSILRRNVDFFNGKVVILTGASRGIGQALAYALAVRGAHLVLAARSANQLEAVAERCRGLNLDIEVMVVPTDVTDPAQLQELVGQALERFERIDILINNAGIIQGGPITGMEPERIERQLRVNLLSAIELTRLCLRPMLARGRGHIVLMASAAGRHTVPYFIPYGVSKHGLVGFGEGLRRELAGTGLRTLIVNPGFTATDIVFAMEQVFRRMGFQITAPEVVALRTLEGIVLGVPEVNIGWFELLGQYASTIVPYFADLYWRLFLPRGFAQIAETERTE